ncbi:MAG: ABC transporter permease [Lutibacter sp.]|nr:ABC transporter permease [Lutibacter sp.]
MNYELFIARRLLSSKRYKSSVSSPIIKIAILAISLGMVVMLISMATSMGLQQKIREKISGFNGHIQLRNFDNNHSETTLVPLSKNQEFYPHFKQVEGIQHVQVYATKAGIIRTATDFEGILLKGVAADYDSSFFEEYLVEGRWPDFRNGISSEVLISREISNRMQLKLGDRFNVLFVKEDPNKPPWLRVLTVAGIYNSGFHDFDKAYVIGDLRHIQKMNRWTAEEVGGFELIIDDFDTIEHTADQVYVQTAATLNSTSIVEKYPAIMEWIRLFDNNTYVIIAIMILVAGINMITALLVLILERTRMIGMLKAMGSTNASVRKVFLYQAAYLIVKGLFWGNTLGITLLLLQKHFHFIALNPETYYVNTVPVYIHLGYIIALNVGTLGLCILMLLLPSAVISKITPVKAIRFV